MTFSVYAKAKLLALYNDHADEVGSRIAAQHPNKKATDCITYVINVLKYAFDQTGDKAAAEQVANLGRYGTKLAAYLVKTHQWKGVYYNPDVNHPSDGQLEHPYSYFKKANLSKVYYDIPISHMVINYSPTPATNPHLKSFSSLGGIKDPTVKESKQLDELKKIPFAVGLSRGGMHTWLYSTGSIYEVHWDRIGSDLYEATNFEDYAWLSGALVVPPDAAAAAKLE
jgi:hypothetical protein